MVTPRNILRSRRTKGVIDRVIFQFQCGGEGGYKVGVWVEVKGKRDRQRVGVEDGERGQRVPGNREGAPGKNGSVPV